MSATTPPLRIAVAGAGQMARHHVQAIQALDKAAILVGVADPSESARTEVKNAFPDVDTATSLRELASRIQPDVVHVCVPMELHARVAHEALDLGAHVYVEKPATPTLDELIPLQEKARAKGLLVCAGHQVLFEQPYRKLIDFLSLIGTPVHVESYFSFRPVRTGKGGGTPLTYAQQLVDVLPHPTYLLLDLLERLHPGEPIEADTLELSHAGTLHGLVRCGPLVGSLMVSLEGRPVEHWLKIVGTNGTVHADFVRGTTQKLLGPGSSGIDKALNPYKLSLQLAGGTTVGLGRRILRRGGGSYPGLREIFTSFYEAVSEGTPSPTSPKQIEATVRVCEATGKKLADAESDERERRNLVSRRTDSPAPKVLVTGGTGLLGREVVRLLQEQGVGVRSLARRQPGARDQVPGVEYRAADLGQDPEPTLMDGIRTVIHCAAETSGGWEAHQRNSIEATSRLLNLAANSEVETFVQISSVAVLAKPAGGVITDQDPLHREPRTLGPYGWGKLESERLAQDLGANLGVRVKVLRPVPLVDEARFEPPGRLGRRIGNLYVAVGRPRDSLVVATATETARAVVAAALHPEETPDVMNLVPSDAPTRGELSERLRKESPEVRVVWLPPFLLHPLSWTAVLAQRLLRRGKPPIRLAHAFASQAYAPGPAARLMEEEPSRSEREYGGGEPRAGMVHAS